MFRVCWLFVAALVACTEDEAPGPYDRLPQDGEFVVAGLTGRAQVARDRFGVAHINATTAADVAFVQGYVTAHDRLPQLDLLRRFATGTLAEVFGVDDPTAIDVDLEMRMHRMKLYAEQTFAAMQANPDDAELVAVLERYADGVNRYHVDLLAETWTQDDAVTETFLPATFVQWTPIDSLAILRFHSLAASWTVPYELAIDELYGNLDDNFRAGLPADRAARAGIANDLVRFAPASRTATIPDFPNVSVDTGSRSNAKATHAARPGIAPAAYAKARAFFGVHLAAGSNAWAVGPPITTGATILVADQHVDLTNPSVFYPVHLVAPGLDVIGVTVPGVPGVMLGSTGSLAWSTAAAGHDVNDLYVETSCAAPATSCVVFEGTQVQLETFDEAIAVGDHGLGDRTISATYEVVPHHGPVIPAIDRVNHVLVPRDAAAQILAVRYTGYAPTFELRALWKLAHATTIDAGFAALSDLTYGAASYVMIDNASHLGWSMHGVLPLRPPAAYTWHPANPSGVAPFFALPGSGGFEWAAESLDARYLPHAKDLVGGSVVATGADPVGATFDGDPLNAALVDARPLYVGTAYTAGFQQQRIVETLAAQPATLATMTRLQRDTRSNAGADLVPAILAAFALFDAPASGPPDLAGFKAALAADDAARLTTARALLAAWTFATPASVDVIPADPDSAATAVFNQWTREFLRLAVCDELRAQTIPPVADPECALMHQLGGDQLVRIVHGLLVEPETFVQSAATGQPIVCDDFAATGTTNSCTTMILRAAIAAVAALESRFASTSPSTWQWGQLHQLRLAPAFSPIAALALPLASERTTTGFPRDGDNFAVNRADFGFAGEYASRDGAAQRFVALADPGSAIRIKWQLPGGTIFDPRNPHYRDLLDSYYLRDAYFDAPYAVEDIITNGEYRWDFR